MHTESDTYEHLGDVKSFSLNLESRYREIREQRTMVVTPEESYFTVTQECSAPPYVVWEWMMELGKRELYMHGTRWTSGTRPEGRTGVGATNHCAHGSGDSLETILDWKPFDYSTTESVFGPFRMWMTDRLEATPTGTRVQCYSRLMNPWPRWIAKPFFRFMMKMNKIEENYRMMARLAGESYARQ
jgi:hypothetical protein